MKNLLPILSWLLPAMMYGQSIDSTQQAKKVIQPPQRPEILNGGFIDFVQNGQMNASARLVRLYIGEPGRLQIPVTIFSGVSANNLSLNQHNEDLAVNLINPGTGIFNLSFDGSNRLVGRKEKRSGIQLQYQASIRYLSVFHSILYKNITFFNFIGGAGLTLVTGAWERSKENNIGMFWVNARMLFSHSPQASVRQFLLDSASNNMHAFSIGMGIEISQILNVKIFYFNFLSNTHIMVFDKPFMQLSFNYSVK